MTGQNEGRTLAGPALVESDREDQASAFAPAFSVRSVIS